MARTSQQVANTATYIFFLFFIFLLPYSSSWADSHAPKIKGEKYRIGYYEGGPFSDYTHTMRTLVKSLMDLGWIKRQPLPDYYNEREKPYWDWLVKCDSSYLSFAVENSYSAAWDDQKRLKIRKDILKKLQSNSLDLIIAMGTWAGLDLANSEHSVPVLVLSTSDPLGAGIIKSEKNSGYDHVTARVDPDRYLRQIRMFHRIVGFKTLGLAYEDTREGRTYAALSEVQKIAGERGFEVALCEVTDTTADKQQSNQSCLDCYRKLVREADAVYLTALTCVDRQIDILSKLFRKSRTPSFSMTGTKFVEKGIMLSISSDSGYVELGKYNARKFGAILNGTKPVKLNQKFADPLDIAVNIKTVKEIGFSMPKSILKVATEIYEK